MTAPHTNPAPIKTKRLPTDNEATRIIRRKINRDAINSLDSMSDEDLELFDALP